MSNEEGVRDRDNKRIDSAIRDIVAYVETLTDEEDDDFYIADELREKTFHAIWDYQSLLASLKRGSNF